MESPRTATGQRGPTGIELRRPGMYRLRVSTGRDANGRAHFKSETFTGSLKGAKQRRAEMVVETAKAKRPGATVTVAELLDAYIEHSETLGRAASTLDGYRKIANRAINPAIGTTRLDKLTSRDLDSLYAALTARGLAPASVRRVHALITAALHQAEKWDWVEYNIAKRATPPPMRRTYVQAPSVVQVRQLLERARQDNPTLGRMLTLAALTGARRGELCALRWADVDLDAGTLRIARSLYEIPGGGWAEKDTKSHQVRGITLDPVGIELLQSTPNKGYSAVAFVFSFDPTGEEPIRPGFVTRFARRIGRECGIPFHLHQLRHFSATQLIAAGYDPVTVAARLGHADPSITMNVYSHALEARDKSAAESLGQALA